MREGPLHAALKAALVRPGDRLEVPVGRFVIDLVRADGELVEVQTGGFGALAGKLDALLDEHRIRIVLLDRVALSTSRDILAALPALPVEPFSTGELAAVLGCSTRLAQRTLYCLRTIGIVEPAGRRGRAPLHVLTRRQELPSGRAPSS
jgi:hypothetical protein